MAKYWRHGASLASLSLLLSLQPPVGPRRTPCFLGAGVKTHSYRKWSPGGSLGEALSPGAGKGPGALSYKTESTLRDHQNWNPRVKRSQGTAKPEVRELEVRYKEGLPSNGS